MFVCTKLFRKAGEPTATSSAHPMKTFLFPFVGMILIMLSVIRIWAQTTVPEDSDPFGFYARPIPLSWVAMGIAFLLILMFLIFRNRCQELKPACNAVAILLMHQHPLKNLLFTSSLPS